jgi:hypothetical protein
MTYANPHAATQIANGLSTTTFVYDNNGNVTQKTTDGTTTTVNGDQNPRKDGAKGELGSLSSTGRAAPDERLS